MTERILVIRHRFIGDTLLMLPMLAALRQACPTAHITVLTAPDSAPLLTHCPYVDERWVFGVNHSAEGLAIPTLWAAIKHARQQRFTAALVLKRSLSAAAIPLLAGIPVRVGFAMAGRLLLSHTVPYLTTTHEATGFTQVLNRFLTVKGLTPVALPSALMPQVWFAPEELAQFNARWTVTGTHHLGFHVGASNSGKQWPQARFIEVAKGWLLASTENTLHILGGPGDATVAEAVKMALPVDLQARVFIWAGVLSLRETAAALKKMDFLVTSDSGLSHLAAAVGTPVRVVFGPTNPQKWHPLASEANRHKVIQTPNPPPCMPCNLKVRCERQYSCLTDVTADAVLASLFNNSQ